jgi:hypothetical protein
MALKQLMLLTAFLALQDMNVEKHKGARGGNGSRLPAHGAYFETFSSSKGWTIGSSCLVVAPLRITHCLPVPLLSFNPIRALNAGCFSAFQPGLATEHLARLPLMTLSTALPPCTRQRGRSSAEVYQ